MSVPALAPIPHVWRDAGGVVWTNSRDVAAFFGKRHAHVLRDIEQVVSLNPDLGSVKGWFRPASYSDPSGRDLPSYDMNRDGFTLLVMGYTGHRAMEFKVRYIEAFSAMEAALRDGASTGIVSYEQLLGAIRETVAPLAVRFDYQDCAISEIADKVDVVSNQVGHVSRRVEMLEAKVTKTPRRISGETKEEHRFANHMLGGRCQGCGVSNVLNPDGTKSPFAEYDHFYANSQPDINHTWLICKTRCHEPMTTGKLSRQDRERAFHAYQEKRRTLPHRQPGLFG